MNQLTISKGNVFDLIPIRPQNWVFKGTIILRRLAPNT